MITCWTTMGQGQDSRIQQNTRVDDGLWNGVKYCFW